METSFDFLKVFTDLIKEIDDRNGIRDKNRFLDRILDIISDRFNVEACSIFLDNDEQGVCYKCVAGKGYAKDIKNMAFYKIDENFTGFVLRQMRPYKIESREKLTIMKELNNIPASGKYDEIMWDIAKKRVFKNLLIIPLVMDNHSIGVLKAENKKNNEEFTDEEYKALILTGSIVTLAVSNVNLYEKFEKSKKYNEIIEILPRLLLSKQKNEILQNLMKQTMDFFNADVCFIFLRNPKKINYLYCAAGAGYAAEVVNQPNVEYELGKNDGLTGTIADSKFSVLINSETEMMDYRNKGIAKSRADQFLEKRGQFRNMIGAPLLKVNENGDEKIVGVIKVENKKFQENFTINDKMMLETIAKIAAISIDSFDNQNNNQKTVEPKEIKNNKSLLEQAKKENDKNNLSTSIELALLVAKDINDEENVKLLNICSVKFDQLEKVKNEEDIEFSEKMSLSKSISISIQKAIINLEDKIMTKN
jgi:GAF domain-containing protein